MRLFHFRSVVGEREGARATDRGRDRGQEREEGRKTGPVAPFSSFNCLFTIPLFAVIWFWGRGEGRRDQCVIARNDLVSSFGRIYIHKWEGSGEGGSHAKAKQHKDRFFHLAPQPTQQRTTIKQNAPGRCRLTSNVTTHDDENTKNKLLNNPDSLALFCHFDFFPFHLSPRRPRGGFLFSFSLICLFSKAS